MSRSIKTLEAHNLRMVRLGGSRRSRRRRGSSSSQWPPVVVGRSGTHSFKFRYRLGWRGNLTISLFYIQRCRFDRFVPPGLIGLSRQSKHEALLQCVARATRSIKLGHLKILKYRTLCSFSHVKEQYKNQIAILIRKNLTDLLFVRSLFPFIRTKIAS